MKAVRLRFYEELNDYLPETKRKRGFDYSFDQTLSIRELFNEMSIPIEKIDLILVNQKSMKLDYILHDSDQISIYPVFETFDITDSGHLHKKPLRSIKFICDVHLGKLSKFLRMLGFDTFYDNNYSDTDIIKMSLNENRIILSKSKNIISDATATHAYLVRSSDPLEQIQDLVRHLQLENLISPIIRCLDCNDLIVNIDKNSVIHQLEKNTVNYFDEFFICPSCKRIYWKGSHYENMLKFINLTILKNEKVD